MRSLVPLFFVAIFALALTPAAISADHEQKQQTTPVNCDTHIDATVPHTHTVDHDQNGHKYLHNILQRLHNALLGRYHLTGTCASAHHATSHNHAHDGHNHHNDGTQRAERHPRKDR
jgi:hypothetical protein